MLINQSLLVYSEVYVMNKLYIANAFSLGMLSERRHVIEVLEVTIDEVKYVINEAIEKGIEVIGAIGHLSTAQVLSQLLNINLPMDRKAIKLRRGDTAIIFQLMERLPEGKILSTEELQQMIEQGKAKFYIVQVY